MIFISVNVSCRLHAKVFQANSLVAVSVYKVTASVFLFLFCSTNTIRLCQEIGMILWLFHLLLFPFFLNDHDKSKRTISLFKLARPISNHLLFTKIAYTAFTSLFAKFLLMDIKFPNASEQMQKIQEPNVWPFSYHHWPPQQSEWLFTKNHARYFPECLVTMEYHYVRKITSSNQCFYIIESIV